MHLAELKGLKYLWHDDKQVPGAGLVHVAGMTNLECQSLDDTQVADSGVVKLKKALPNCRILRGKNFAP